MIKKHRLTHKPMLFRAFINQKQKHLFLTCILVSSKYILHSTVKNAFTKHLNSDFCSWQNGEYLNKYHIFMKKMRHA